MSESERRNQASPTLGGTRPQEAESCADASDLVGEAWTGELVSQAIEPRKPTRREEPALSPQTRGHGAKEARIAEALSPGSMSLARQHKTPAREPGDLGGASPQRVRGRQGREGDEPHDDPAHSEESDPRVVPEKPGNKRAPDRGQLTLPGWFLAGDQEASADPVEGRRVANGKSARRNAVRTQGLGSRAHVTERIGRKAKAEKEVRFNNLLGHVRRPLLHEAFDSLRKDAAAGVDGETWVHYEQDLEVRLADLEQRIHRGSYHPWPVRRVLAAARRGGRPLGRASVAAGRAGPTGMPTHRASAAGTHGS